jgi:AmpE protein
MVFLAMLLALVLHQLAHPRPALPGDQLLQDWSLWVGGRVSVPWGRWILVLAPPLWLLHALLGLVGGWFFGLAELLAAVALIFWALGREDYPTSMARYAAHIEADDSEAAWLGVQDLWMPAANEVVVEDERVARRQSLRRLLYTAQQRWFAPLFYLLLLGPLAAVAYRAVLLLARGGNRDFLPLLSWLDWAPTRLVVLGFSVIGDFSAVMQRWRSSAAAEDAAALLQACAVAACGGDEGPRAAASLMQRSAGLWLLAASLWFILR